MTDRKKVDPKQESPAKSSAPASENTTDKEAQPTATQAEIETAAAKLDAPPATRPEMDIRRIVEETKASPPQPAAPPPAKGGGKGLAAFSLLIALAAGGGSGYLWYLWDQEQRAERSKAEIMDARVDERVKTQLEPALTERDQTLKGLQDLLGTQQGVSKNLRNDADSLQSTVQAIHTDISSLQSDIRTLQGSIQTLKGGVEIEKGNIEIQKNDTRTLQADIRTLQGSIQSLQAELQSLKDQSGTQAGDIDVRKKEIQALQEDAQALQGNLQALQDKLAEQTNKQQEAVAQLATRMDNFNLAQRGLLSTLDAVKTVASRGGDVNALPLSEVEYLLRMADHKLKLQQDVEGALAALTVAQKRLQGINETAFRGVEKMIGENIASLRGIDLPDRSALAHKIVEMEKRVDELPMRTEMQMANLKERVKPKSIEEGEISLESEKSWLAQASGAAWKQLKDIIVIRHERSSGPPLIAVEEKYFLYQNLRLELEAMRLALLSSDATNYQNSNELARSWLETYFNTDDDSVAGLLSELKAMQTVQFNPYIPDISSTLRAFRDVMERREPIRATTPAEAMSDSVETTAKEAQQ